MSGLFSTISVDYRDALQGVRLVTRELKELTKAPTEIKVNLDQKAVKKALQDALGDLNTPQKGGGKIVIQADTKAAKTQLRDLQKLVADLKKDANITLNVGGGGSGAAATKAATAAVLANVKAQAAQTVALARAAQATANADSAQNRAAISAI